jgi:hypothetical protein
MIERWTVWVFAVLPFIGWGYGVRVLGWMGLSGGVRGPTVSAFPEVDLAARCATPAVPSREEGGMSDGGGHGWPSEMDPYLQMVEETLKDLGRLMRGLELGDGDSMGITSAVKGRWVFCGSMPGLGEGDGEHIVLLTDEAG